MKVLSEIWCSMYDNLLKRHHSMLCSSNGEPAQDCHGLETTKCYICHDPNTTASPHCIVKARQTGVFAQLDQFIENRGSNRSIRKQPARGWKKCSRLKFQLDYPALHWQHLLSHLLIFANRHAVPTLLCSNTTCQTHKQLKSNRPRSPNTGAFGCLWGMRSIEIIWIPSPLSERGLCPPFANRLWLETLCLYKHAALQTDA